MRPKKRDISPNRVLFVTSVIFGVGGRNVLVLSNETPRNKST